MNQKKLIEIAKLWAKRDGWETAEYIGYFGITDQLALIEIAKLCAQNSGGGTAKFIGNFEITDQQALIEIAKLCAKNSGGATAIFIGNFGIKDEAARREIAELCAQNNPKTTAINIKNFKITEEQALITIAELCVKRPGQSIAKFIGNFEITNQQALINIAKLYAKNNGKKVAINIKNFGITDQLALIEIAKIYAQNNGRETAEFIGNFGITNQAALIEIAKLCAQNDGWGTAEFIGNFGITDQAALIEIAHLCIQNRGWGIAEFIGNFGITDQAALIEIAMLCIQKRGWKIAEFIDNFGITDQAALIEIAMLCAQKGGWELTSYIKKFGIQNPKNLIDIIMVCFENSNALSAKKMFKFLDKNSHLFIKEEKILLLQGFLFLGPLSLTEDQMKLINEEKVLHAILSFGRPELRSKIFMHVIEALKNENYQTNLSQIPLRKSFNDSEILTRLLLAKLQGIEGMDRELISKLFSLCYGRSDSIFYHGKNNQILVEVLLKFLENPKKVERSLEKLYSQAEILLAKEKEITLNPKELRSLTGKKAEAKRLEQILLSSNELLQIEFTQKKETLDKQIAELEKKIAEFGEKQSLSEKQKRILTGNKAESNRLRDMLLGGKIKDEFAKQKEALDKEIGELEEKTSISEEQELILVGKKAESNRLEKMLRSSNEILQKQFTRKKEVLDKKIGELEGKTNTSQEQELILVGKKAETDSLKQMLLSGKIKEKFAKEKKTLDEEIAQLERKYSPTQIETSILKSAKALLSILLFNDDKWISQEKSLPEILESLVRSCLPIGKVEDFAEVYNREFTLSRNPSALNTYVAKLSSLEDSKAELAYLGKQVTRVLNGTYKEERYSLENNSHLTKINEINSELLNLWKQDLDPIPVEINNEILWSVDTDNFTTILLAGTEVSGSCQHIDGNPQKNKGLLGYMDGKNRMLTVPDGEGRTVSRCLLRLVLDENNKPALFRDRFYPETISDKEKATLNALAIRRAEHLGLSVFYSGDEWTYGCGGTLKSLEGPMPWEYCDSAEGLQKNGVFTIKSFRILQKGEA